MNEWRLDPAEVARARALAAGDLARELVRFALRFAQPVVIGQRPVEGCETKVNTASATMLRLDDRPLALTCAHVVRAYRTKHQAEPDVVFQIGGLEFDPIERLVDEDDRLDLAVLDLSGLEVVDRSVRGGAIVFHEPGRWPPGSTAVGDHVSLGGFPGTWRDVVGMNRIEFDTFSLGGQPVATSSRTGIACQFDRDEWVQSFGTRGHDLQELGGLSGAPVMVMRELHWELSGIIKEFSSGFDLLYVVPAIRLRNNGTIDSE